MSAADRLAAFFRQHPNTWVSAIVLMEVSGQTLAWRTRTAELRRPPFNIDIRNKVTPMKTEDGRIVKYSSYRWIPRDLMELVS